jgi:lysophospholipase L1-like esterase/nitrous oxidase accessory protein NosD
MRAVWLVALGLACLATGSCGRAQGTAEAPAAEWREAARRVHAKFTGRPGTFAQFGDSITVTQAYWSPLRYERRNASPEMERAFARVNAALLPECWGEWKGPEFGSEGGQTVRWADANVAAWLKKLNPEVALIMFGSNDLHSLELEEYRTKLRSVVQRCLDNGTVVILSTIPPRHGFEKKAEQFVQAERVLAAELKLPLIDYYAEILKRRPEDWDGALERFKEFQDYEVPTLISRDGVHPSFPKQFQSDYSEQGIRSSGYTLRSYLTLMKYDQVLQALRPAQTLRVHTVEQLYEAAAKIQPGGTIIVTAGRYELSRSVDLRSDGVTLRGEEGGTELVILDGGGTLNEGIRVTACSDVTIRGLTLQNVRWNGIKIDSETGVQRLRIADCILKNIWQRAIKGVAVPAPNRERLRPRDFIIERCRIGNDRPKQFSDDPADTPANFNGDYIGGIDVMYPVGWTIRDNVFTGIRGRTRQARGAVFLWFDARDCVIERNVMVDCDSGICLGNSHRTEETQVHASRCLVRNNFITRGPENGILADYTRDCRILHNTVFDPESRQGRGVRIVHDNDGLVVANNLLAGPKVRIETESRLELRDNREGVPASLFRDPVHGDLRLKEPAPGIVDAGTPLKEAAEDIDRRPRGARPDLGAHELSPG